MSGLTTQLAARERRAGASLAMIYAFRMLGLFMVLPVFAIYAETLPEATPVLVGLALGVYGLTQAALQIPMGYLSDRIGRKPVIAAGLLVFALGSLLAAASDDIYGIIIGRALQGAGAIAAALMALAADLSREEHRTKMMAMIGASIGAAFAISMVAGPMVYRFLGMEGIFVGTAVLALLGIAILYLLVPDPIESHFHLDAEVEQTRVIDVLRDGQLLRLDAGIFFLHFILMALFLIVPLEIRAWTGWQTDDHWKVYLPMFFIALLIMLPFIIIAEKKRQIKAVFVGAIVLMGVTVMSMNFSESAAQWLIAFILFFTSFNLLEAMLPSLVSKTSSAVNKGTAMGVYSSSQFAGTFIGGVTGGLAFEHHAYEGIYTLVFGVVCVWLLVAISMRQPRYLSTLLIRTRVDDAARLIAIEGVEEVSIIDETPTEHVAYLKIDKNRLNESKLAEYAII